MGMANAAKSFSEGGQGIVQSVSKVGETIGNSLSKIPLVGGALGGAIKGMAGGLGMLLGSAMKTSDGFSKVAQSGATFGGSLTAMRQAAQNAGYGFENFTKAVSQNTAGLSGFGGSATQGATALSSLLKTVRGSRGMTAAFQSMGVSLEQQPEMMANFMGSMSQMGMSLKDFGGDFGRLANTALGYQRNMTLLSELTGKSAEEQKKANQALATDAAFQASILKLRPEERAALQQTIAAMSPMEQEMAKQRLAFGGLRGEAAKAAAMFPAMGDTVQSLVGTVGKGRTDFATQLAGLRDQNKAALTSQLEASADTIKMMGNQSAFSKAFIEGRQLTLQNGEAAKGAADAAGKLGGSNDALSQGMRQLQTAALDVKVAFEGLGFKAIQSPEFHEGLKTFSGLIQKMAAELPGAIDKMLKYTNNLAGGDKATVGATAAAGAGVLAATVGAKKLTKAGVRSVLGKGATPPAPNVDAGVDADPDGKKANAEVEKKTKGKSSWFGKLLKGGLKGAAKFAGPIGLVVTAGMGIVDAVKGFNADKDATLSGKLKNAGSSLINGLTFGLLGSSSEEIKEKAARAAGSGTPETLEGRAAGGPVSADKIYKVGEKGPEIFAPGMDGTILPAGVKGALQDYIGNRVAQLKASMTAADYQGIETIGKMTSVSNELTKDVGRPGSSVDAKGFLERGYAEASSKAKEFLKLAQAEFKLTVGDTDFGSMQNKILDSEGEESDGEVESKPFAGKTDAFAGMSKDEMQAKQMELMEQLVNFTRSGNNEVAKILKKINQQQ
jgi:hypothetical protein